ncbi:hypothetical protein JI739_18575 [Ramlibacter sp. AW1]|uniref:Uncharacterized protein n=1 Tax=Ramlibacter aurantiacus TaxID=2801330 RepID=A0A937D547_9BURK|nr:hypothetical protein [Ramlibacter aurantiacus]MBL0422360.1 hypothetical protein [Ramlibacter aurantiacus]
MKAEQPEVLERIEDPRPLFPGEHWVDVALGLAAWLATRKHPSLAVRTLGVFIGATLVARGAHGHREISQVMRWTPVGGGIKRDSDHIV